MDFEQFEKEQEEKQKKPTRHGSGQRSVSPAHAGIPLPDSIEDWEFYWQYGHLPRDFHGF